jgi:hypothetical protein
MTMSVSDQLRRMGMIGMVLLLAALGAGILSLSFLLAVHQCPPVTGLR